MLLKYCFLLLQKGLTQILRCFLCFSKLIVVLSMFYLLFNLDLVIMAFLKVLSMKGLSLYLRYFQFKGASFSRVKLKGVLKLLRESSDSDKSFIRVSAKSLLSKFLAITATKEFFTFTFGKGNSANRHYQFILTRYSRLFSARFHNKESHICNNMINGRKISAHRTRWCFDSMT